MKRDNVNYLFIGVFVMAMLCAFLVLIFAVTGRSGPSDDYVVYYANVAGLKFGTGVFYEGFRVGQIETITPQSGDDGTRYEIQISVEKGWKIPRDSVARVQSSGLISAVRIEIEEGEARDYLSPGDIIAGKGQADLFAVLNQAAGDFHKLSQEGVMPLLDNLNVRVTEMSEEILSFKRDQLSPFVSMMHERVDQELISEVVDLIKDLDDSAESLKLILGADNRLRVESFLVHIDDVSINLNELISRIELTRQQMGGVLGSIGALVEDNKSGVTGAVDTAEASVEELELALKTINQHLEMILFNLEGGSRHMSEFARAIRENPSRLIRNSRADEPGTQ